MLMLMLMLMVMVMMTMLFTVGRNAGMGALVGAAVRACSGRDSIVHRLIRENRSPGLLFLSVHRFDIAAFEWRMSIYTLEGYCMPRAR